ncbi:MAG TPA: cytochrome P450 [Acidimicrobiales bacterium]
MHDHLLDPREPSFFTQDAYFDVLSWLRAEAPVREVEHGFWTVARYSDIRDLSRNPAHFCSGQGVLVNDPLRGIGPLNVPSILHMDPPEHAEFRGLLNRRFTPRGLAPLADSIRATAVEVLDAVADRATGEIDFVSELAAPFPLVVIAELLGIDKTDRGDFRRWSDAAIESPDLPPEETGAALTDLSTFIMEHIRAKRDHPGEDLVSLLVQSEVNGCPLQKMELFMFLLTLLVAGNETTRTLLSGATKALYDHPDQRAVVVDAPELMPVAMEECLRWVTPVHAFCRTVVEDCEVAGSAVRQGDYLCMLYASGNRDESVFGTDASVFDVQRPANPMHVAFGFGEHVCLGASLARLESRIFLEEMLARYPSYAVTGPAERVASTTVAGIRTMPVVLAP